MNMSIQNIMLSIGVNRFHTVDLVRQMSLAEHHYLVTMTAMKIAAELAENYGGDHKTLTFICLTHDLHEIFDGDIPTPAKERNGDSCFDRPMTQDEIILKCADLITDAWFSSNYQVGRNGRKVAMNCLVRMEAFIENKCDETLALAANKVFEDIISGPLGT